MHVHVLHARRCEIRIHVRGGGVVNCCYKKDIEREALGRFEGLFLPSLNQILLAV